MLWNRTSWDILCGLSVHQDPGSYGAGYPVSAVLRLHWEQLGFKGNPSEGIGYKWNTLLIFFFLPLLTIECLGQHRRVLWTDKICFKWVSLKQLMCKLAAKGDWVNWLFFQLKATLQGRKLDDYVQTRWQGCLIGAGSANRGPEFKYEAPMNFPVALGKDLGLKSVHKMEMVVTSSLYRRRVACINVYQLLMLFICSPEREVW